METLEDLERALAATDPPPGRATLTCATALCSQLRERFIAAERNIRQAWEDLDAREAREALAAQERARQQQQANRTPLMDLRALYQATDNDRQCEIFDRLDAHSEDERLYLVDFAPNTSTDRKKAHIHGIFTMLGSMNNRGQRSEYTVQLYKHGSKPKSFWCNCPDHKFNSTKRGTLCKHISFILLRYAKMFDAEIFKNQALSEEQFATLAALLERPLRECPDIQNILAMGADAFIVPADKTFVEDDVCPICYEDLAAAGIPAAVNCPTCHQCMHKECVTVWLERKNTCVMCRSDVWKNYRERH